jgi:hypothetical protein
MSVRMADRWHRFFRYIASPPPVASGDSRRWLKPPGWHLQHFGLSLAREGQRRRIPRVKGGCGGIGSLCRDRPLDELVETLTTSADVDPPDECPL